MIALMRKLAQGDEIVGSGTLASLDPLPYGHGAVFDLAVPCAI